MPIGAPARNSQNAGIALLSRSVGQEVAAAEWARGTISDLTMLECNCDLVETLMLAVFPPASFTTDIAGAIPPFQRHSFYHTPRFAQVLLNAANTIKQPLNIHMRQLEVYTTRMAYQLILEKVYGVQLPLQGNIIFTVPDYSIGLYRHYSVEFNSTFLEVQLHGEKPELTAEQLDFLSRNPQRTEAWLELLPPEHFELVGFNILHLVDVTEQEILSELKYDLLERDVLQASDRLEQIQEKLRVLFGKPFLQLGIAAYDEKKRAFVDFGRKINHSFLTKQLHNPDASSGSGAPPRGMGADTDRSRNADAGNGHCGDGVLGRPLHQFVTVFQVHQHVALAVMEAHHLHGFEQQGRVLLKDHFSVLERMDDSHGAHLPAGNGRI